MSSLMVVMVLVMVMIVIITMSMINRIRITIMCLCLGRATFCQTDPENHGDEQYQSRLSILMVDVVLVNKDKAINAKMPRIAFCLYKV